MGMRVGFSVRCWWLPCALLIVTFATPSSAGTRAQLSESVNLFGAGPAAAPLPTSLVCTASRCAAFTVDSQAGSRVGGVLLDASGAPIEATRVDFGRSGGSLHAVAAGDQFVIAGLESPYAYRILLLDSSSLSIVKDLSTSEVGRDPRALYSNGKTVLLVDYTQDDVATTIDLASGSVVGTQTIADFYQPAVIPGSDQYLFFYPIYGGFRRLSSLTGQWLGAVGFVAPDFESFESSGYFRDGVYQLVWREFLPTGNDVGLSGIRVNAETGQVIEQDADGKPAPQRLCENCPDRLQGAFQRGAANYFWSASLEGGQTFLEMNPATGLRSDPSASAADVSLAGSPGIFAVAPFAEPRLLLLGGGSICLADTANVAQFITGEPRLPGRSSGVKPTDLHVVSNGESFLAAWNADHVLRASWVTPSPKPALAIEGVVTRELGFPELRNFAIASANGKYLIAGLHENDDASIDLLWRVMDGSGKLGSLVTEPASGFTSLRLGSDGERYLLALFTGAFVVESNGTIVAQRLSAEGEVLEPLTEVASGVALAGRVDANFAAPLAERHFAVNYRTRVGTTFFSFLATASAQGAALAFERVALSPYLAVNANDGHSLLLSGGAFLDLADNRVTPHEVPSENLSGLSHWDGNAYVTLTSLDASLIVNEVSPKNFAIDGQELHVTEQLVGTVAAAASDGSGRSLVVYFATEAPDHFVELRGALLQTERDGLSDGEAGAGGAAGNSGEAGAGGELAVGGIAGAAGNAGSDDAPGGSAERGEEAAGGTTDGDRSAARVSSRACGCAVPGVAGSNLGAAALALLAIAAGRLRIRRRRA